MEFTNGLTTPFIEAGKNADRDYEVKKVKVDPAKKISKVYVKMGIDDVAGRPSGTKVGKMSLFELRLLDDKNQTIAAVP